MRALIFLPLLPLAVAVQGFFFLDDVKSPSSDVIYPHNLGWLFDKKHTSHKRTKPSSHGKVSHKSSSPHNLGWLFRKNKGHISGRKGLTEEGGSVCENEECKKIAKVLKESMDETVNPCTDFYQYACGNWEKNNPVPEGEASWNMWEMVTKKVADQVKEILNEGPKSGDFLPVKLAKKFYRSCVNTELLEKRGLEPMVAVINRIGGWPMAMDPDEWDEDIFTWQKVDDYYVHVGDSNSLYKLDVNNRNASIGPVLRIILPSTPLGSYMIRESNDDSMESGEEEEDSQERGSQEKSSEEGSGAGECGDYPDDDDYDDDHDRGSGSGSGGGSGSGSGAGSYIDDDDEEGIRKKSNQRRSGMKKNRKVGKSKARNTRRRNRKLLQFNSTEGSTEEKPDRVAIYADSVTEVALAIAKAQGNTITREAIAKDVKDMMNFMISMKKLRDFSTTREVLSISELQKWYDSLNPETPNSKINWYKKIMYMVREADLKGIEDLRVMLYEKEYIENLIKLLDSTSSRTIVNYIHWLFISHMLGATTERMRNITAKIDIYGSRSTESDRLEACSRNTEMLTIVGYEYVRRYFDEDAIEHGKQMIATIQKEMKEQISNSAWLDEDSKEVALRKLENMKSLVGYPSWYKNETLLKEMYKGVSVTPFFFENMLNYQKMQWKIMTKVMAGGSFPMYEEEFVDPTMVNAFYAPYSNTFAITAADLQEPFFGSARPFALNYAIIGLVIGHEIGHGFDSNNFIRGPPEESKDDEDNEDDLKTLASFAAAYDKRAYCFIEQYNEFAEAGLLFNVTIEDYGNQTLGENIADTMGLEAVYQAYKTREKKSEVPQPSLPGLENFNNDQLFFLSFSNMWCEAVDVKKIAQRYKHDSHSPGRMRILGPLQNSKQFAEAFKCPVGSPMNPERKCNIWN